MASIRIVSADYYMSYPNCELDIVYSEFRGAEVRQVPVIQIFGSTQEGKKTCLNIHGVFPYVYIPYDGNENAGPLSYKIACELDKTINTSLGQGSSNTNHVHNILLVSGLPIYGYHEKQHQFFKIYFYNPAIIKKACSLLENGAILGKCFQPHESHISYILQFMVDYNLHGMSFINVSQVKYRPNPKYPEQIKNFPKDKILPNSVQRRSVCEIEMDCFACDITNIEEILSGRLGTNPGIAALWDDERQRRRDKQQDSQISFCLSQERETIPEPSTSHEFFALRLSDKLNKDFSETSSVDDLDNSVYPAETPDDSDYLITTANTTSINQFDDTITPGSPPQLSQTDRNLLEILKELKENVHIEEDSALSQQNAETAEAEDEEEMILSLPLNTLNKDVWNDSFWDDNCAFPQLDGTQDVQSVNGFIGLLENEVDPSSGSQEFRYANEVFIPNKSSKISLNQQLNPGVNTLVTTEPKNLVAENSRIKILSDLVVKPDCNVKVTWNLLAKQLQLQLNIKKNDLPEEEFVDPLPFADDGINFENELDEFDINEIILNDVNMGNLTPTQMDNLMDELSPKTPHAHANQCSCRQSPCNSRLFDQEDLFNDRLYENNLLSSGDKENVSTNSQTLNAVKRNLLKCENKYNLRSTENTPKGVKLCCADTKVKKPQLKLRELLNKLETKRNQNENKTINTGNNSVLVQIPLTKLFKKRGRPKQIVEVSGDEKMAESINENNNNKIISAENELINIPLKKRGRPKKTDLINTSVKKRGKSKQSIGDTTEIKDTKNLLQKIRGKLKKKLSFSNAASGESGENTAQNEENQLIPVKKRASRNSSKFVSTKSAENTAQSEETEKNQLISVKKRESRNSSKFASTKSGENTAQSEELTEIETGNGMINIPVKRRPNKKLSSLKSASTKSDENTAETEELTEIETENKLINSSVKKRGSLKKKLSSSKSASMESVLNISRETENYPLKNRRKSKTNVLKSASTESVLNISREFLSETNVIPSKNHVKSKKNVTKSVESEEFLSETEVIPLKNHVKSKKNVSKSVESEEFFSETENYPLESRLRSKKNMSKSASTESVLNISRESEEFFSETEVIPLKNRIKSKKNVSKSASSESVLNSSKESEEFLSETEDVPLKNRVKSKKNVVKSASADSDVLNSTTESETENASSLSKNEKLFFKKIADIISVKKTQHKRRTRQKIQSSEFELSFSSSATENESETVVTPTNISFKKRNDQKIISESSESTTTTESDENNTTDLTAKIKLKLEKMNWNLDGQNDTPSSESEHSQKNGIIDDASKPVRTRSSLKHTSKVRVSGLVKTTRKSLQNLNKLKDEVEDATKLKAIENDSLPRQLRTRKSNTNLLQISVNETKASKRKSEINSPEKKFETLDEFKENQIEDEKKTKIEDDKPVLRNRSRFSEAERNLKRQKRMSLSLKHLREKQEQKEKPNNLKELRVSLTQMPLDKLSKTSTTIKDVKIILEQLSPKILEKYSCKTIESSPPKIEEPIIKNSPSLNEVRRETRSTLKPPEIPKIQLQPEDIPTIVETSPEIENKRTTRQSIQQQQSQETETKRTKQSQNSSDSCEEILFDEELIKRLNTTPTKKAKNLSPSPRKYTPLNVVRSPRNKPPSAEIDPLKKRLRNFDSNLSDQENVSKKVKICAIDDDSSRGIGELQDNPIIQEEEIINEESKIETPSLTTPPKCNSPIYNSPKSGGSFHYSPLKTPECALNPINNWKQKEENFLNEIESICKNAATYNHLYYEENTAFKTPEKIQSPEKKIPAKLVLRSSPSPRRQSPNVTPKKSIITSADYLDYSPFASPEKGTVSLPFFFNSRETLSQQFEKELENDSEQLYTKTKNLTVAEMYDLRRNFAPQPGTSKDGGGPDLDDISEKFSQNLTPNILCENSGILMPKYYPPSAEDVKNSLAEYNILEHRYETPFYGDASDVTRQIDVGNNVLKIPGQTILELEEFKSCLGFDGIETCRRKRLQELFPNADVPKTNLYSSLAGRSECIIQPALNPPSCLDVINWLQNKVEEKIKKPEKIRIVVPSSPGHNEDSDVSFTLSPEVLTPTPPKQSESPQSPLLRSKRTRRGNLQKKALFSSIKSQELKEPHNMNNSCQISGVTLNNTHGFKLSYENLQNAKALNENQHLTVLVVEVHCRTRGDLNPDPQYDAVRAIFYSIYNDVPCEHHLPKKETGIIAVNSLPVSPSKNPPPPILNGLGINCVIQYVDSELKLIDSLIQLIQKWDPDIFSGFEIELLSWGYLIERGYILGINLPHQLSRTNPEINRKKFDINDSNNQELKLTGRIVLDAWRLFRHEIALTSYTFENLMYHILHQRVPHHSFKQLTFWWDHRSNHYRQITAQYYITRTEGVLKLMDQLDLIGRTSELARLFGIQFYEVLSRGSQFRVESMMLRLAKPLNYIPVSPSQQQRAKMRAPEWIPLIFEPESRLYVDPVIVLDFQSLYPSIIIAYNYCFSTCVGRVDKLGTNIPFEFGSTQLKIKRSTLLKLQKNLTFSPCGVGFVTSRIRKGILPRMLQEILETRLMVKASMKQNKDDKLLQRVLHSRQLGLKLIANVTYGYTAANFSGRMSCSEVADSVVSKGRETLERAVKMIQKNEKWRAQVVYGDTDSLFVQVPGRSREDAFKIGEEIAEAVTRDNPAPVKLKLEKIYQPCILQTKKRYVGYMYETVDQKEPEYNAKGIETVRRDGCPAVAKMLEKCLRILFETRDVSLVKRYVCHQFEKILTGRASVQDLIFAREYRGASGYKPGACVPALELARRWTATDKRKEPRQGERVPYIIVHGPPGVPLIRLVRCPKDLLNLEDNQQQIYRPNAVYYITKVIIPPLNRCFTLIGADVNTWYNEMPRKQLQILPTDIHFEKSKKSTISEYFATMNCVICNNQTREGLCEDCFKQPQKAVVVLQDKIHKWERINHEINQICESCCSRNEQTECSSLDCPILYRLIQSKRDLKQVPFLRNLVCKF